MAMPANVRAEIATEIGQRRHEIAAIATEEFYKAPYWMMRFGAQGKTTCLNDNLKNIDVLALSIRNQSPMIVDTHVDWLRGIYLNLGMCSTYLTQAFGHMQSAGQRVLSQNAASEFDKILRRARGALAHKNEVCQQIIHHQDTIVELVTKAIYVDNPYWYLRFKDRGLESCKLDMYYNTAYLVDALEMDNTKGVLIHTGWMRNLLVSLGMCTQCYMEAWQELINAVKSVVAPEFHSKLDAVCAEIMQHLQYDTPLSSILQQDKEIVLETITRTHYDRARDMQSRLSRSEYMRDTTYKLSYLVDADAQDNPAIFSNYIDWVRESLLFLHQTPQDLNLSLAAIMHSVPNTVTPAHVLTWLQSQQNVAQPQRLPIAPTQFSAVVQDVQEAVHGINSVWQDFIPAHEETRRHSTIESALMHIVHNGSEQSAQGILSWLLDEMSEIGGSRAYILDFVEAAQHSFSARLDPQSAAPFVNSLQQGLADISEDDPALMLLQIPNLVDPIIETLRDYSPYWQQQYQRRAADKTRRDVFVLIALLADDLMDITNIGFPAATDMHRQYLLKQGICTAYYQQMIDLTMDVLEGVVDAETADQALLLTDAANAILESDDSHILAIADVQDPIVNFVIDYLQQNHPNWVSHYPGGWDDATTDMYYWLGYLSDAMTFGKPQILTAHILWLHDYARRNNQSGDHIKLSLIALGHAIKMHLPEHAAPLLTTMSDGLKRLNV